MARLDCDEHPCGCVDVYVWPGFSRCRPVDASKKRVRYCELHAATTSKPIGCTGCCDERTKQRLIEIERRLALLEGRNDRDDDYAAEQSELL